MSSFLKKLFSKEKPSIEHPKDPVTPKKPRKPKIEKSAKDLATERGEPYINIISFDLDPNNVSIGAFELDWNHFFVLQLMKQGYKGKDEEQIVDQWFQDICRNIVLETYEQLEANNPRPPSGIQKKDLGDGRTEVS